MKSFWYSCYIQHSSNIHLQCLSCPFIVSYSDEWKNKMFDIKSPAQTTEGGRKKSCLIPCMFSSFLCKWQANLIANGILLWLFHSIKKIYRENFIHFHKNIEIWNWNFFLTEFVLLTKAFHVLVFAVFVQDVRSGGVPEQALLQIYIVRQYHSNGPMSRRPQVCRSSIQM